MDPTAPTGPATVVVSRRVRPGREPEFERWLQRLLRAVRRAPGYVGAVSHPPGPDHPAEWVVVYQFSSSADLDAWLASRVRHELMADSRELVIGDPQEQRLVEPPSDSVTLVSSARLRPGTEGAYRVLHDEAAAAARRLGGVVSVDLLAAIPGAQPDTVALITFASRSDLQRWIDSPERAHVLEAMGELAEGARTVNVVGGFAGWFRGVGGRGPRRWKQAVVVLAGLLPVALVTTLLRQMVAPEMPWAAALAATAVINVAALTWLVMPALTRAFGDWLVR